MESKQLLLFEIGDCDIEQLAQTLEKSGEYHTSLASCPDAAPDIILIAINPTDVSNIPRPSYPKACVEKIDREIENCLVSALYKLDTSMHLKRFRAARLTLRYMLYTNPKPDRMMELYEQVCKPMGRTIGSQERLLRDFAFAARKNATAFCVKNGLPIYPIYNSQKHYTGASLQTKKPPVFGGLTLKIKGSASTALPVF